MVMHTLSSEFTLLRVVNGETVAAHNLGVTNGFVKPKLGRRMQTFICVFLLIPNSQCFQNISSVKLHIKTALESFFLMDNIKIT